MPNPKPASDAEQLLRADIAGLSLEPYRFVKYAYPWGVKGSQLEQYTGPRDWQRDALEEIGQRLRAGYALGAAMMPVLKSIASGHGIGKSALIGWVIWWALSTFEDTRGLLTANTQDQLRTRTWPEVVKWTQLAINRHWFRVQGSSIISRAAGHDKSWRCDYVTWSLTNLAAFAGLHNAGKRLLMVYDEASGIDDKVWDVTEGALTDADTEIIWLAFGNPTEPSGRFSVSQHAQRERWRAQAIDSRHVPGTNLALFAEWAALYGEDSDFFRVRVRGMFPSVGATQFIGESLVEEAAKRDASGQISDALVLGVDVARFGSDQTVIYIRKGRDGRTWPPIKLRNQDTMQVAARVAEAYGYYQADAVFVDGGGVGAGVIDRLRQLRVPVSEIQFGAKADRISLDGASPVYANKRAEMWGNMREWLKGGAIPNDPELRADLTGPQYSYVLRDGRDAIMLERKEDMALRGLASPDVGDALALTFAYPVVPAPYSGIPGSGPRNQIESEWDPRHS